MTIKLRLVATVVVLLCVSTATMAMEELEFVSLVRQAALSCSGAPDPVQKDLLETLRHQLSGATLEVISAITTDYDDVNPASSKRNGWRLGGDECDVELSAALAGDELINAGAMLIDDRLQIVILQKEHQDLELEFRLAVSSADQLTHLRKGQKSSVRAKILRVHMLYGSIRVHGVVESIETETVTLKCAKGHEYAPSAGFKFCPQDGLPLK